MPHLKLTYQLDQKAGAAAIIRVEQTSSVFDLPVTLTLQYTDRPNSSVIVKMTERVAELRVPLTGTLRGVELSRDDGTLAIVEK